MVAQVLSENIFGRFMSEDFANDFEDEFEDDDVDDESEEIIDEDKN